MVARATASLDARRQLVELRCTVASSWARAESLPNDASDAYVSMAALSVGFSASVCACPELVQPAIFEGGEHPLADIQVL
jgi:hypothetical protein